ncbi:uncharacterized protein LOC119291918 [Triticum dicoccoides]|uniref:uncharacterized protein LOC119291918 n=1 Tax=Triticum dicoccoides TaxID=85692 RepID=UPI00188FA0DF|nr:uncharacterized protein LOC119291918 [Triticum dicoccoides]XP_044371590.1 uncharacterized protein LOC123093646 [Triticum aestivum]
MPPRPRSEVEERREGSLGGRHGEAQSGEGVGGHAAAKKSTMKRSKKALTVCDAGMEARSTVGGRGDEVVAEVMAAGAVSFAERRADMGRPRRRVPHAGDDGDHTAVLLMLLVANITERGL